MDRDGSRLSTVGEPGYFSSPYLSPDGKYLVAAVTDHEQQTQKLWLFDFHRGTANPFTFGPGYDACATVWSPDGQQVAFCSMRENGQEGCFSQTSEGGRR